MLFRKGTTFAAAAKQVLRLKEMKAPRTQANAHWQITRLVRNFGTRQLDKLTEDHWLDYIARESARRPRKFYDDRKYMRMILRFAVRRGLVRRLIDLPIPDRPCSSAGREILPHELALIERHANPTLRFQIRIAWKMGLRLGEMLRLRWEQIDLADGVIRLTEADTKMRRARAVPIPSDLIREFRRWKRLAPRQNLFTGRDGHSAAGSNKTAWRACLRRSGVKTRWHDLRHTAATVLLRRGVAPFAVGIYLGMSEKTLRRYTHAQLSDARQAAEAMAIGVRYWQRNAKVIRELRLKYPPHLLRAAADQRLVA
jgi:integrase